MPQNQPSRPWGAIFSILGALVYGASPLDVLPDVIPLLGWADDLTVFILLGSVALKAFHRWQEGQRVPVPATPPQIPPHA